MSWLLKMVLGGWASGILWAVVKRMGPAWHDAWALAAQDYAKVQTCDKYPLAAFVVECDDARRRVALTLPVRYMLLLGQGLPYCGAFECPDVTQTNPIVFYVLVVLSVPSLLAVADFITRRRRTKDWQRVIKEHNCAG